MAIKLDIDGKSIVELRMALKELKGEIASATDPNQMLELAAAAGQVQDKMSDVNEQVAIFSAGSQFEVAQNALSAVGDSLLSLNFEKANEQATILAGAANNLSFKGAIQSVKDLGSTFATLGKVLVTNPLFLLAAVVTLIVTAIVALLSKMGLLQVALDSIKQAVDVVIAAFEKLTDWLGFTENAATAYAQATIEAGAKAVEAANKDSKAKEDLFKLTKDLTDEEISLLEQKLGVTISTSESIYDIKAQELDVVKTTTQASIDALEVKKKLSDEEKAQLEDLKKAREDNNTSIIANEQQKQKAILDLNRSVDQQLKQLLAGNIADEKERSKAIILLRLEESKASIEQSIRQAQQLGQDTTKLQQLLVETEKAAQNQISAVDKKAREDRQAASAAAASKAKDQAIRDIQERLKLIQDQNTLEIASTEATSAARLQATKLGAEEEAAFLQENAKALGLISADGDQTRLQLALLAIKQRVEAEQQAFTEAESTKTLAAAAALDQRNKAILSANETITATEASRAKFELDNTELVTSEKVEALNVYQRALLASLEAQQAAQTAAIDKEIADLEAIAAAKGEDVDPALYAQLQAKRAAVDEQFRQARLTAEQTIQQEIDAVQQASRDKVLKSIEKAQNKIAEIQQVVSVVEDAISSIGAVQDQVRETRHQAELEGLQEGSEAYKAAKERQAKEDDIAARKQFETAKALQIANAVVQGAQAVLAAFSSGLATPIIGPATGAVFAGIAAGVAAANIAKIKATKYKGGGGSTSVGGLGGSGSAPSAAAIVDANGSGGPATPQVNLFGQGNNQNTANATPGSVDSPTFNVTATVSESEVTSTQQRVSRLRQSAEL